MANASVIRQFLVSLGWEVDQAGMNRFATSIAVQSEAVRELGEGMKAAALKVGGFVRDVVDSLDQMYVASKQTKASVANLEAVGFALEQVGQKGATGTANIKNLYNLLATNPNEKVWLQQNLGVQALDPITHKLRDTAVVYGEMVEAIAKKQFQQPYLDSPFTGGGLDNTLLEAMTSPEYKAAQADYLKRQKETGQSADDTAYLAHELANALRQVNSEIQILSQQVLPALKAQWDKLAPETRQTITDYLDLGKQVGRLIYWWEHLSDTTKTVIVWTIKAGGALALLLAGLVAVGSIVLIVSSALAALAPVLELAGVFIAALTSPIGLVVLALAGLAFAFREQIPWNQIGAEWDVFTGKVKALADVFTTNLKPVLTDVGELLKDLFSGDWAGVKKDAQAIGSLVTGAWTKVASANAVTGHTPAAAVLGSTAALFSALEKKYNLPAGLTDSVYAAESSRGKNMYSARGAMGPFQFMPATAKEFGLDNPYDLGASADAFARKMSHLLQYYKGDLTKAVAAYNWGEGNIDRKGLAGAPQETRDYVPKVLGGLDGGNPYAAEMPARGGASSGAGAAAGTPAITQHITTTVTGAADPQAVGKAVGGAIDKGNVLLVGALQGRTS